MTPTTEAKKIVGDKSGSVTFLNLSQLEAPSTFAASIRSSGIDARAALIKMKMKPMFCQIETTAITGSAAGNTAIGYDALTSSTVSSTNPNTAIGFEAMQYATTATNNTAIGNLAMQGSSGSPLTTGDYNVAVGASALKATAAFLMVIYR